MSEVNIFRGLKTWIPFLTEKQSPMIFITGPRQVGKTFLSKTLSSRYYNWDTPKVKKNFLKDPYFFRDLSQKGNWVIFDEIHKRRDWKKLLKGYYDSPDRSENFIVTGSGRFDLFQKGGDSLQGRYDLFHLYPLTWDEVRLKNSKEKTAALPRDFENWTPDSTTKSEEEHHLFKFGGFPVPFLQGKETSLRKWEDLYIDRLIREDIRDISAVQRIDQMELLARLLPERVGSPVSLLSLSEDIGMSTVAAKSWLRLFETLYLGFQLPPFYRKIHRKSKTY